MVNKRSPRRATPEDNPGRNFVGSRVRQLRRERDLSQAQLDATLGLSASYVNQI